MAFDPSRLNDYASRMLDRFLTAFPEETLYTVDHSEDYYVPDGDRFIGAWVIEWLCPAGGYDWNVRLSSSEHQLIISWGGDHEHFQNWDHRADDPEAAECLAQLRGILSEQIWNVYLYRGDKQLYGRWCKPDEVRVFAQSEQATRYEIKSWRGTFDQAVSCDNE